MSLVKYQAVHAIVANAPQTVMVVADDPLLYQRTFRTSGPPSSSTLATGNGRYCAASSGFIIAATLYAAGADYTVADVLTLATGTASTTLQITVDEVDAAGAILNFHVSRCGVYTVYPNTTAGVTGGTGTGASFLPALQPADHCLDVTDPAAPKLWACTTAGSNSTSVWAQISGATASLPVWI